MSSDKSSDGTNASMNNGHIDDSLSRSRSSNPATQIRAAQPPSARPASAPPQTPQRSASTTVSSTFQGSSRSSSTSSIVLSSSASNATATSTTSSSSASTSSTTSTAFVDQTIFHHDASTWRHIAAENTRRNAERIFRSTHYRTTPRPSDGGISLTPTGNTIGQATAHTWLSSHTPSTASSDSTSAFSSESTSSADSRESPSGRFRRWSRRTTHTTLGIDGREATSWWPNLKPTFDPARKLTPQDVRNQRLVFFSIVFAVNAAALIAALTSANHNWVFAFILFVKSADCIKSIFSCVALVLRAGYRLIFPPKAVTGKWILTLIPAYSESEEQIVKTVFSLRENDVDPHKQVMCVILDGRPRDIRSHMTLVIKSFRHEYTTSKHKQGELKIDIGFMEDVPIIVIEKVANAGKKDSLILCHDLFNSPRSNLPFLTLHLRELLWTEILPMLTTGTEFTRFDMIFCTDADSTIFKGAVASLANALARDPDAIAACGLLFVELEPGQEWSIWTLYQMFQYSFGQFVRRQAEGLWGKVTCLPGCITMIAVRPEMAEAIRMYAEPILAYPVIFHQVQYLGTDRRLTFQMLNQGKKLRTLFVPAALSETAAPQSTRHYLSQRRRWGSNAYYNDYFYAFGKNMILVTRIMAVVDIVRLTMVYYRIANTILFIYGLAKAFDIVKLIPLIVVSQIPMLWFTVNAMYQPELRKRSVRLALGFVVNKLMSPFISVTVFTTVVKNLGSQVWGLTGITQASPGTAGAPEPELPGSLGDRHEADTVAEHLGGNVTDDKHTPLPMGEWEQEYTHDLDYEKNEGLAQALEASGAERGYGLDVEAGGMRRRRGTLTSMSGEGDIPYEYDEKLGVGGDYAEAELF